MALAVEKSSYSAHGHEVTSPPSDADQGETIRIVTEAVEQNEPGAAGRVAAGSGAEPAARPRVSNPPSTSRSTRRSGEGRRSGRRRILIQMINPNHREDTQVAAGLGNRSQIREELPLSTRVHELAKELGLKSQELLERIQKWGLDVKANALASLDPPMVDRIRELMDQPAAGDEATSRGSAASARSARRRRRRRRRRASAGEAARVPRPHGPDGEPDCRSASRELARDGGPWSAGRQPCRPVAPSPAAAAPQRLIPGSSPSGSARPPVPNAPRRRTSPPVGRVRLHGARRPPVSARAAFPERGPPEALFRPTRRIAAPGPGPAGPRHPAQGPRHEPRAGQPSSQAPSAPGSGPAGFQPLKRDDYMSSAGTRPMTPRVGPSSPSSSGPRRPGGESGGDGEPARHEPGSGPALAQRRRAHHPAASRRRLRQRSAPAAPMPKTQRPEKSVTREEMLALDEVGWTQRASRPPGGHRRAELAAASRSVARDRRPGQPRGGPALGAGTIARRPAPGPGSPAAGRSRR